MYAHVRECTSRRVKGADNPDKALQLRVLLTWALHLSSEGRHVHGFDVAILGAFARVSLALLLVHLLDHVNGLASARARSTSCSPASGTLRLLLDISWSVPNRVLPHGRGLRRQEPSHRTYETGDDASGVRYGLLRQVKI